MLRAHWSSYVPSNSITNNYIEMPYLLLTASEELHLVRFQQRFVQPYKAFNLNCSLLACRQHGRAIAKTL
jgi:hypothetical protein